MSRPQPTPYIVAEHVCKSFGTHQVLRDVSTHFNTGEVTVIIGASGSGKSTLLRAINRLEETYRVHRPTPVNSIMTQGCLAKGKDVTWGGGLYDYTSVQAVGLADAGDSLYALNKLVFEDRRCTLPQLVEILNNFKKNLMF